MALYDEYTFRNFGSDSKLNITKAKSIYIYYFCCFYVCSLDTYFYWLDGASLKCLAINLTCLTELALSNEVVRQIKVDTRIHVWLVL